MYGNREGKAKSVGNAMFFRGDMDKFAIRFVVDELSKNIPTAV